MLAGALVLAGNATSCFGWGEEGHEIVARIAQRHLTPQTRQELRKLLGSDELTSVSTWADHIRRKRKETASWHYVDFNIATGVIAAEFQATPNILEAITSQSAVLVHSSDAEQRADAAKYVIHFVGDLHQPLHCSDNNDKGGNEVHVSFQGEHANLHSLWDKLLLERYLGELKLTPEQLAQQLDEKFSAQREALEKGTPEQWAKESFGAAREVVYKLPASSASQAAVEIDDKYYEAAKPVLDQRLSRAGYRLARQLNTLLGGHN